MKKMLLCGFLLAVCCGVVRADVIIPGKPFKPTHPPRTLCTGEYCVVPAIPQKEFSYKILYAGLGTGILFIGGACFVLLRKKRKK